MKRIILALSIILSGCVVAPVPPTTTYPQQVTTYMIAPPAEQVYIWDASLGLFFYWLGGRRYYMPHGYQPRHYHH